MKYVNKDKMKETAVDLYLKGKNYSEIAKLLNCSRNYVSTLIRDDEQVKRKQDETILKVDKNYKTKKMRLTLSINYFNAIGISENPLNEDFVNVYLDRENEQIIIKKHKI